MKAVGVLNYVYALYFGANAMSFVVLALMHLTGRVSAPWITRPGWIAVRLDYSVISVLALFAGLGFRGLRPWAFRIEMLFLLGYAILLPLSIIASSRSPSLPGFIVTVTIMMACITPLLNLPDVWKSRIFLPEYVRVIAESPGVRVKAKLPWALKVPALVLLAISLLIITLMHPE